MKYRPLNSLRILTAALGAALGLVAYQAQAQNQYFDVNGATSGYGTANGGSYSWDANNWGVSGGAGATTAWTAGTFARFYGANNYTVTVNNDESVAGLYQNGGSGHTLTINAAGVGDLNIVSGDQGFLAGSGTTLIINAPIVGSGGLAPELSGTIYLNGNNSYSGGTTWGYSGTPLVYFNNNNAFGTGPIKNTFTTASVAPMLSYGGTVGTPLTITLNNAFQITGSTTAPGAGFNFANGSYTPLVLKGDFTLGANSTLIKNNGDSTAPLTLNGNLNSTGVLTLAGNNGGTIILNGANAGLTGTVAIGASGGQANVRVVMATKNTLASATMLTLAGGTLDPAGLHQTMGLTTLGLTDNSTIDYGAGAAELDLANSAGVAWTSGKALNLANWTVGDALRFGTDSTGLTTAQLAEIESNGNAASLGTATLDPNGFVVFVPEPSSAALGLLGVLGAWIARRKKG
jgi:hypothetical protein